MRQLSQPVIKPANNYRYKHQYSSDQAQVTQLWHQTARLINAIEQVNWSDGDADFQFELCSCGHVGCRPQGWVSLRRLGSIAVILPAFGKID